MTADEMLARAFIQAAYYLLTHGVDMPIHEDIRRFFGDLAALQTDERAVRVRAHTIGPNSLEIKLEAHEPFLLALALASYGGMGKQHPESKPRDKSGRLEPIGFFVTIVKGSERHPLVIFKDGSLEKRATG